MKKSFIWSLCHFILITGLLALFITPASTAEALGSILFVSATGSGTDCSQSNPCLPWDAMDKAIEGDMLLFAGGDYFGISDPFLTINKAVTLQGGWDGAPTGDVLIDPESNYSWIDGEGSRALFEVNETTSVDGKVTISNFIFIDGHAAVKGGAINIINGLVDVIDNTFSVNYAGTYGGAIYTQSSDKVHIIDNYFSNNWVGTGLGNDSSSGGGAIMTGSGGDVLIEGNHFSGGHAGYGTAIHNDESELIINRNYFYDMDDNHVIDLYSNSVGNIVSNNMILWSYGNAIRLHGANTGAFQIINNTIFGGDAGLYVQSPSLAFAVNNIFSECVTGITNSSANLTGTNNLFYNNESDPVVLTDPLVDVDPQFVDPVNDDIHLSSDSPAIDAGVVVALTEDFDGDSRPLGNGYDIGADETGIFLYLPLILK